MNASLLSHGESGSVFGRMFAADLRQAPPLPDLFLQALAETMNEGPSPGRENRRREHSGLDAGYTYLGQFIDHDLSSDRSPFGAPASGSPLPRNFRTPCFDLDCLYGDGPGSERDRDLYELGNPARLRLAGHDLVRKSTGRGYIRDSRNDTNRIVSQIHIAFARSHNRAVDALRSSGAAADAAFASARTSLRRHYQWIVLHEYLPVIVGQELVNAILPTDGHSGHADLRLLRPAGPGLPSMPVEFSAAAFRLGHSMVRNSYRLNRQLGETFLFPSEQEPMEATSGLRGLRPLPESMVIEWEQFFTPRSGSRDLLQLARPIDPLLTNALFALPPLIAVDGPSVLGKNLAYRNLVRGEHTLRLPTGQELAAWLLDMGLIEEADILGKAEPFKLGFGRELSDGSSLSDLAGTGISLERLQDTIAAQTPLWYYVLKEAEVFHQGEQLGKVGGRIVAEVFIKMLLADGLSILNADAGWRPTPGEFGCVEPGSYRMTDLLGYAQP